jgi:WD40 repeat protein
MAGSRCYCVLCAVVGLALAYLMTLAAPPAAHAQPAKGPVSFINDIAPILKQNCYACHDAKKKKGKLELTSYENLRKGGTKDDPIVPGKSKESYLIDVLTSTGPNRMPPKDGGDPLPAGELALIAKWIDEGAKLDQGVDAKADLLRELRIRWKPPLPPVAYKYPININAIAFTPDGKKLVVGGYHELTVWDLSGVASAAPAKDGQPKEAKSKDEKKADKKDEKKPAAPSPAPAGEASKAPKLEKRIFTRAERAYSMLFLPDGKLVVAGGRPGQEGDVRIYDLAAGKPGAHGGAPSLDGVNDKTVFVKELVQTDDAILALALSPDGKKLASAGTDRLLRVWDLPSGKLEYTVENHADWVFGLAFAPDGKHLVTASRDKTAKVWDLSAKESMLTFPDHQNTVYSVAMTPDGAIGISAGEDNQIRQWQATDKNKQIGKQTKVLGTHNKAVFRMAMAGDAKNPVLATCSADGTVKLWNPVSGAALKTLTGHTDWVYAVALSPDGQLVASGAWNGEVRIWRTADGNQAAAFNASPGYVSKVAEVKK